MFLTQKLWCLPSPTFNLYIWPWPASDVAESWVLHFGFIRSTSVPSFLQIPLGIAKLWSGHDLWQTDRQTDGRTLVVKTMSPLPQSGGRHKYIHTCMCMHMAWLQLYHCNYSVHCNCSVTEHICVYIQHFTLHLQCYCTLHLQCCYTVTAVLLYTAITVYTASAVAHTACADSIIVHCACSVTIHCTRSVATLSLQC